VFLARFAPVLRSFIAFRVFSVQYHTMHITANMVEIPMDKVEEGLCQRAVPGFTGTVLVYLKVKPTAGFEVEFRFESEKLLQISRASDPETPHVTNARVNSVRRALTENANLFRLGTSLAGIRCSFVEGELRKMTALEVE
jgi:hypothetical protein